MTKKELDQAMEKALQKKDNLLSELANTVDWVTYLKEELDRHNRELLKQLSPNGNVVKES